MTFGLIAGIGLAAAVPLEWNVRWPADVPYEVNVNTAKLARAGVVVTRGLSVTADGKEIAADVLSGDGPEDVRVRFSVPGGTRALAMNGRAARADAQERVPPSLFDGAIADAKGWTVPKELMAEVRPEGLLFMGTAWGASVATRRVPVPPGCAGKPVRLELDVTGLAGISFPALIWFSQYDAAGKRLPENVCDARWTSHQQPPGKLTPMREAGRLHLKAAFVQANFEVRSHEQQYDIYGQPLKDPDAARAKLLVSRLAIRVAADIPFPGWNPSFFTEGASGKEGDRALVLDDTRAFWFNTRSAASWAQKMDVRRPVNVFFPVGAGRIEAKFKPAAKQAGDTVRLFAAAHHNWTLKKLPPDQRDKGTRLAVDWSPRAKTLTLTFREKPLVEPRMAIVSADLPSDRWTLVAVAFTPRKTATLIVDGTPRATVPIPDYVGLSLGLNKSKTPNTIGPTEFYVGATHAGARVETDAERRRFGRAFYCGAVDDVRLSDGTDGKGRTCARFTFDGTFDGASDGGIGWIPGTIRADEDRVAHTLCVDGKQVEYFPAEVADANSPHKQLDRENFRDLPTDDDLSAVRRAEAQAFDVKPGGTLDVTAPKELVMDYVEIANTGTRPLACPIVLNEGEVDPRSWGDIADSLGTGPDALLSDREKAMRLFAWLAKKNDYFINHTAGFMQESDRPVDIEYHSLWELNCYGRFECGPMNELAWRTFTLAGGLPAGQLGGYGHGFEQVFYDGKNRVFDLSPSLFFPAMDNEGEASLGETEDAPGPYVREGAAPEFYVRFTPRGFSVSRVALRQRVGVTLRPGERFRACRGNEGLMNDLSTGVFFDRQYATKANRTDYNEQTGTAEGPHHIWRVDRFFPDYANGYLTFDGKPSAVAEDATPTSFVYRVAACYPVVAANYAAFRADGTAVPLSISTDGGATWRPLDLDGTGTAWLTYKVRARTMFRVRVDAALEDVARFRANTVVEMNNRTLTGNLRPGANRLAFKAEQGDAAHVTFGYRVPTGRLGVKGVASFGTMVGYERHVAALDPTSELKLEIGEGLASMRPQCAASPGIATMLDGRNLSIRATDPAPRVGWVAIRTADGGEYVVTLVVAPGVRLVTGVRTMEKEGDTVAFPCDLPAGRYAVLVLDRFPSHAAFPWDARAELSWTGRTSSVPVRETASIPMCSAVNRAVMLHKQNYGVKGGRAAWKWDFPLTRAYPYEELAPVELPDVKELTYRLTYPMPEGAIEIGAVLVLPWPEREFRCDLIKALCGLNYRTEQIRSL